MFEFQDILDVFQITIIQTIYLAQNFELVFKHHFKQVG